MEKTAMAATSHPLATETALEILKAGGNAMDAAVAACAVQCVVEPQSTGIGGDCFCLYSPEGSTEYVAYNGSGRAPAGANGAWYRAQGISEIAENSPHAVTIPGAVDAWDRLISDYGNFYLSELLQPAINYARNGYKILDRVGFDFARNADYLKKNEYAANVFMPGGTMPKAGDRHRQEKLANTLEIIAENGRDGFYKGEVAEDIVGILRSLGGLHTLDDFANYSGNYVTPISASYRGYQIYQCPPNGQGLIALMLLKIMERLEIDKNGPLSANRIHQEIEVGRLAYHQRDLYLADPEFNPVPVDEMLGEENIKRLAATISDRRLEDLDDYDLPDHKDTVYITVVDKDRNCCSFINTIFRQFGSGIMAPRSGVLLHNRGRGFSLKKGHPNEIAGGKRPLHTIIPGMVAKDGRTVMSYGVMGGQYQAFGHMQFLTRFLDYGLDIQAAMDLPRFFADPISGKVEVESEIEASIQDILREKGHNIVPPKVPIGGSQAIWIDWEKDLLMGGSDPRKDGLAAGYSQIKK
ncbi:MAG TPA: gamma-glutamyltransferase [Emcibacteraceae bacterium]|nr:gamma-glutamyltransferase [Emcibacteraceae bacterium]